MERGLQIVCYVACLIFVYFVGGFLQEFIWQSREYWDWALNRRPLIGFTMTFTANHRVWPYVIAFPWVMLIGLPLLTRRDGASYWDRSQFYLRLVAFAVVEITLLTLALIAMTAPALQMLKSLPPLDEGVTTVVVHWAFWLFTLMIGCLAAARWWRSRRQKEA